MQSGILFAPIHANARGGRLEPGDNDLIANAMESPTDMLHLRDEEARAIMAPHEATPVVANLEDLFPAVPGPGGTRMGTDPEVAAVIRSAAGTLRARAAGAGVTAGDITDMISTLRGDLGKGGIEGRTAERAINHLQDMLDTHAPDAGAAARQMSDAYAARSRMLKECRKGMLPGCAMTFRWGPAAGKPARSQRLRFAGRSSGRALGQGNQNSLGAWRFTRGSIARHGQAKSGIDQPAACAEYRTRRSDLLSTAARAQDESAQALASASQQAQAGSGGTADAEMLVQAIAGLHPSSFYHDQGERVRRLLDMTYIPESRARAIIDMLFSQDPKLTNKALKAIGNEPNGARFVKYLSAVVGQSAANMTGALGEPGADNEARAALGCCSLCRSRFGGGRTTGRRPGARTSAGNRG
jgi:hypothetical protein